MKFEYTVNLKEGYKPTMQSEEKEIVFIIAAKNTVTAERKVKAMLKGAQNVTDWTGICIED